MHALIDAAFQRTRAVVLGFIFIILAGIVAWSTIPKESEPDVAIPIIYVTATYEGISPEDAERLLVRPLEKELQSIEGVKEMRSTASEGYGGVLLEFDAGFDSDRALNDVREKVDMAKSKLPPGTDEPTVNEINVALFPVLTVTLSGAVPERTLVSLARDLKDSSEARPGVLEVDIGGDREEVMEVVVDTTVMETYGINYDELLSIIQRNNMLVAAGAIDTGAGRMAVKVPGVIEDVNDVLTLPIKAVGDTVVTFRDVAQVRRTYKDPEGFARVGGEPAVSLEVSKRLGANIIETIAEVRRIVEAERAEWPAAVHVDYLQDKSDDIRDMLRDLQNNVASAVLLVMIVIIAVLGIRPGIRVGLSIPGSFLAGIMVITGMGYTMNLVVLFSLIMVVGMLVDGAIVVVELAERKMAEGLDRREAYAFGAKRMSWPIIASTATTLAVFFPLLVWPGVVGEFMKYLPITVLITLTASLGMALIFIPVLGGLIARRTPEQQQQLAMVTAAENGDLSTIRGFTGGYLRMMDKLLRRPGLTLLSAMVGIIAIYAAYGTLGRGVEFFPDVEPQFASVQIHARGDLSIFEKDRLVQQVEQRVHGLPELKTIYARTISRPDTESAEDLIGSVQVEFLDWQQRRPARDILEDIRQLTADIPGITLEVREQEQGPGGGKPIHVEFSSRAPERLPIAVHQVRTIMDELGGFMDVEDSRPLPGIEWRLRVDRELAAQYGADVAVLGNAVQMVTQGVKVAEYRPAAADEEIDIRVRLPLEERSLDRLGQLRVPTMNGMVPAANFVRFEPAPKTGTLKRTDARRVLSIKADVADGLLVDDQVRRLRTALANAGLDPGVDVTFKGQDADQREAATFLIQAFGIAIFLIAMILVLQFNSIYQTLLVLSAIVLSTAGVLLGLLLTWQPFGIVMSGLGLIALAGIVVNNNIVLIDTFNEMKARGQQSMEAVLRTCAQRMRPVLLTSFTTVLGLMPMVFQLNIDLIGREITHGAPSTQWWTTLSSTIAGGLTFATILTLVITPCMLMLGENVGAWFAARRERRTQEDLSEAASDRI
ncbi:MAG: efflux RND transporter permease subunit [Ectothiorhodospiraceae bacterium]|nr:efflux RND transporter permease subunit [Ectothiorhodospiraceae bacterium]